jgi:YXWGXW repeat-containing protein
MRVARLIGLVLTAVLVSMIPIQTRAQVAVGISVQIGPPALPVYGQPICREDGYIWTPGYWAYGDDGYYWVPGTWQFLLGHVSVQTTERYWGCKQRLREAVNDRIGLETL